MPTAVETADPEVARVAFVSTRFVELQGLRRVVDGCSLLLLWTLMQTGWPETSPVAFLAASLIWVSATMWGTSSVSRYYRDHFGRVAIDGELRDDDPHALAYAVYRLLLVSAALWLGGWFGFILPLFTIHAARVTWRDWPHRQHWLLLVFVGAAFSAALLAVDHRLEMQEWQWRFIWTAAPALIAVGCLDHRILVRSTRRVDASAAH
jgi:hypothetical protein